MPKKVLIKNEVIDEDKLTLLVKSNKDLNSSNNNSIHINNNRIYFNNNNNNSQTDKYKFGLYIFLMLLGFLFFV